VSRRVLGFLLAILICAFGVLLLPWFIPPGVNPIVSDSQIVGFSNRTAMIALGLAVVVAFVLANWHRKGVRPFVMPDGADTGLSGWLVLGVAVATGFSAALMAYVLRGHAIFDQGYFLDRMLLVTNGNVPYSQFEFAYGPGLLYFPTVVWTALRHFGASLIFSYDVVLVTVRVLGVLVVAYVLNRLDGPNWLRTTMLLIVSVYAIAQVNMGLQWTLLRYAAPLLLMLVALRTAAGEGAAWKLPLVSVAAVIAAFVISPEMGVAVLVALLAAAVVLQIRRSEGAAWMIGALLCVALVAALPLGSHSTFTGFAGGTYYLPVIAGPPVLLYLLSTLIVASAAGEGLLRLKPSLAATQAGWIALSTVMIAPALGRADFGHVFWNGLPVLMAAPVIVWQWRPRLGLAAVALVGIISLAALGRYTVLAQGSGFLAVTSPETLPTELIVKIAPYLGISPEGLPGQRAAVQAQQSMNATDSARLLQLRKVAIPQQTDWSVAARLAERHALVPSYDMAGWGSSADAKRTMDGLAAADYLVLPVETVIAAGKSQDAGEYPVPTLLAMPAQSMNPMMNSLLYGVPPFKLRAKYAQLDPLDMLYAYLTVTWRVKEQVGGYVVLVKQQQAR
jgi:hypothetical protein